MSITDAELAREITLGEPRRRQFGDRPHQTVPDDWTEPILRFMWKTNKALFRKAVLECLEDDAVQG